MMASRSMMRLFSTMTREGRIRQLLEKNLQPSSLTVIDHSGGCEGGTIEIHVTSQNFQGKSRVAQHRLVNKILEEEIKGLHAISLQTTS